MTGRSEPVDGRTDGSPNAVAGERGRLIGLAYRLLGSVAEAEDAVHETYARWFALPGDQREAIQSPGGWLTKVATRVCLDMLGSARVRRERYVGEWLPEPVPELGSWLLGPSHDTAADPADWVALDESISMAFLVVLDAMTPAERVAFVLHDVFRYSFAEIAELVDRTPAACRQLASSARKRLRAARRADSAALRAGRAGLVREFKAAWHAGDIAALIGILDPDAVSVSDGGGLARAALRPIRGAERVARAYADIAATSPNVAVLERSVNGRPGLVVEADGVTVTVIAFDFAAGRITRIWAIRNPEKLRLWVAGEAHQPGEESSIHAPV